MREIIFRSWNETDQCFYYFTQGLYFDSLEFNNEVDAFCFKWTNAEEFTGLTDKNGNKIFEGKGSVHMSIKGIGEGEADIVMENGIWCVYEQTQGYAPLYELLSGNAIEITSTKV